MCIYKICICMYVCLSIYYAACVCACKSFAENVIPIGFRIPIAATVAKTSRRRRQPIYMYVYSPPGSDIVTYK